MNAVNNDKLQILEASHVVEYELTVEVSLVRVEVIEKLAIDFQPEEGAEV